MADYTVTGTVKKISGNTDRGNAGVAITQGDWLFFDTGTSTLAPADCVTSESTSVLVGIALHDALVGQPASYALPGAVVDMGSTAIVDAETYVLSTAGLMAPVADLASNDYVSYCGYGTGTANQIVVMAQSTKRQVP